MPPIEVINARVAGYHGTRARVELTAQIHELLGLEDLVSELMGATGGLKVPREDIVKALANNPRRRATQALPVRPSGRRASRESARRTYRSGRTSPPRRRKTLTVTRVFDAPIARHREPPPEKSAKAANPAISSTRCPCWCKAPKTSYSACGRPPDASPPPISSKDEPSGLASRLLRTRSRDDRAGGARARDGGLSAARKRCRDGLLAVSGTGRRSRACCLIRGQRAVETTPVAARDRVQRPARLGLAAARVHRAPDQSRTRLTRSIGILGER